MPKSAKKPSKKSSKNKAKVVTSKNQNNNGNFFNWLLWWQVDEQELKLQVKEYDTLPWHKAARKLSASLLMFSAAVTLLFIFLVGLDSFAVVDVTAFLILAFFIWKGKRWAMVGAMFLWSAEKLFQLTGGLGVEMASPITTIIWWTVYMHAFYLAYKVEGARN